MKKYIIVILLLITIQSIFGQHGTNEKSRYIGFDINPILSQILPLNKLPSNTFNASLISRSYSKKGHGLRIGYGLGLDENSSLSSLFFSVDYDKRRGIANKWIFFYGFGYNLKLVSGNNFSRFLNASASEEQVLAVAGHWGMEYVLNPVVSFSTELNLRLGIDLAGNSSQLLGFIARIDPPISFKAHFNIIGKSKKK